MVRDIYSSGPACTYWRSWPLSVSRRRQRAPRHLRGLLETRRGKQQRYIPDTPEIPQSYFRPEGPSVCHLRSALAVHQGPEAGRSPQPAWPRGVLDAGWPSIQHAKHRVRPTIWANLAKTGSFRTNEPVFARFGYILFSQFGIWNIAYILFSQLGI